MSLVIDSNSFRSLDTAYTMPTFASLQRHQNQIVENITNMTTVVNTTNVTTQVIESSGNATIGGALSVDDSATFNAGATINTNNGPFIISGSQSTHIASSANETECISLIANGGSSETILIYSERGTANNSVELLADYGGVKISGFKSGSDTITLHTGSAGGITIVSGTNNTTVTSAGAFNVDAALGIELDATRNISIGTTNSDGEEEYDQLNIATGTRFRDITIGNDYNATHMTIRSGGNGMNIYSGEEVNIDATSNIVLNSSDGNIYIGNDSDTGSIIIGTGEAARSISIGNPFGSSSVNRSAGTGGMTDEATGSISMTSFANSPNSIYLHANGGVFESIKIHSDQGTQDDSINIVSDLGGITINAAATTTITNNLAVGGSMEITGGTTFGGSFGVVGETNINSDGDNDTSIGNSSSTLSLIGEVITVVGTTTLNLNATGGDVNIGTGNDSRDISIGTAYGDTSLTINTGTGGISTSSNGQILVSSLSDEVNCILISANGGSDESLRLMSNQGTASNSVNIVSVSGGVTITAANDTTISNNFAVGGNTNITGNTYVEGTVDIDGATTIDDTLEVSDATTLLSTLNVTDATTLSNTLTVAEASTLSSTLTVLGSTQLDDTLTVQGASTINNTLHVTNGTVLDSTLNVTGLSTLATVNTVGTCNINTIGTATTTIGGMMNMNIFNSTTTYMNAIRDVENSIYIRANGGPSENIKIHSDQGTSTTSINILSDEGGITLTTGVDAPEALYLHANGGNSETIKIRSNQGTSTNSIDVVSDVGGITLTTGVDAPEALYLHANGGSSETIKIHSNQGTSTNSIDIVSDVGGITLTTGVDASEALYIHANGGASETIKIHSDQGTSTSAIDIVADVGGITLTTGVDYENAIYLHANGGSSETIKIHSNQGTGLSSINILSDIGGIAVTTGLDQENSLSLQTNGGTSETLLILSNQGTATNSINIESVHGGITLTSGLNATESIYIHADAGTSENIHIHSDQGTGAASINIVSDVGGITLTASGNTTVTNNLAIGGTTSSTGRVYQGGYMLVPVGSIFPYAVSSAPSGYLLCDGSAYSRSTYSDLFSAIGTTFGSGNGTTTFNMPDFRNRLPVGAGSSYAVGATGGNASITLSTGQLPAHSHTGTIGTGGSHTHQYEDAYFAENNSTGQNVRGNTGDTDTDNEFMYRGADNNGYWNGDSYTKPSTVSGGSHTHTLDIDNTGSGNSIDIRNPFLSVSYIIKY